MLNLVCALNCEAQPIIKALKLKRIQGKSPFPIYRAGQTWLIVSGTGRIQAAIASAWLQGRSGPEMSRAWLNVGIAGHASLPVGKGLLAHKVSDGTNRETWYPQLCFRFPGDTAQVTSHDAPDTDYAPGGMHDMEAAGFMSATTRFSSLELIHCYKVISDNPGHPITRINQETTQALISESLGEILTIAETQQGMATEWAAISASPPGFEALLSRHHFTSSQRPILFDLLRQWQHRGLLPEGLDEARNARAVIKLLTAPPDGQDHRK